MKTVKFLFVSIFMVGSLSASAECGRAYANNINDGIFNAAAGMLILPVGIHTAYQTHQMRKMDELIKESKAGIKGKRTKGLFKSLEGIYSVGKIQKIVLENNKYGKFCRKTYDPRSGSGTMVVLYRDFKNGLRLQIDTERNARGQKLIWTDPEDLQ